jgi:hypothetical protein
MLKPLGAWSWLLASRRGSCDHGASRDEGRVTITAGLAILTGGVSTPRTLYWSALQHLALNSGGLLLQCF